MASDLTVTGVRGTATQERNTSATSTGAMRPLRRTVMRSLWVVPAVVLIGLVAAAIFYQPFLTKQTDDLSSIAVLPFENSSEDSDVAFLCDGIPESVINRLSYFPNLKVISRASSFSMRDQASDPRGIGEALGVRILLLGRLDRRGDQLSISAELADTRDSRQIWGEKFSRPVDQVMEIEEEIAASIADRLELQVSPVAGQALTAGIPTTPEAYQLYLKANI